jgi:hypothetical protein
VNINSAFPSTYIKASDLEGRTVTVTIREVKMEQIGRERDNKPVLYFVGKEKGLVLNKTNARKIASLVGDGDTDNWAGANIAIYPTETEFSGDMVECIRVKGANANGKPHAAPAPAPITDDDVPF